MHFRKLISSIAALALIACAAIAPKPADAAALTYYAQNKILDWLFRAQSFSPPATLYVALVTSASSASGCGTEVSGGSYARVSITSSLTNWAGTQSAASTTTSTGTSGQTSNNIVLTYAAPTANWGTVVGFCVLDAVTSGNPIFFAPLTVSQTINSGAAAPSFSAAALTYTIN